MDNLLRIVYHLGKNFDCVFTMHELAREIHIPYATFYRTIQRHQDLIQLENVGRAKTIRLDLENSIIHAYLAIASYNARKEFLQENKQFQLIDEQIHTDDIVLLFGSYAKGMAREQSDIDIMIINSSGKNTIPFDEAELLLENEINPICFTQDEFEAMLHASEENVGKQAVRAHIVLKNPSRFWTMVTNALRSRKA